MKKVSTVAVKRIRNVSQQKPTLEKLTIGLDLGDRWSWYCVLDEAGSIVLEQKLGTTPKAMRETFGGMPRSRIASLETGMHSPWVSRLLSECGHEVIVAHARNVRLIGESRKKDDRLDAQTLARLARIDPELLSPVKQRSAKLRRVEGERSRRLSGACALPVSPLRSRGRPADRRLPRNLRLSIQRRTSGASRSDLRV